MQTSNLSKKFKERNKTILLGVTASIALYKSCDLIRLFTKSNYNVKVILSHTAASWISATVFEALSGNAVITPTQNSLTMPHIDLRQELDLFLIAPATADCIARAATGRADDPLCATLLSFNGKRIFAPSMNPFMYQHPATQKNLEILTNYGYQILSPVYGESVCKDTGQGKMMKIEDIFKAVEDIFKEEIS